MGWVNVGIAAVGLVGTLMAKRAAKINAADKAARDARAQARVDAGDPNQIVPDDQKKTEDTTQPQAPPAPPSVTATTSNAVAQGMAAGIRQRKRAAAAGNPLFGRKPGAPAPAASYQAKTLVGS